MEFFRKELSNYSFLFQYAVLDIQEEMCKYFLSNLMRGTELRFEKTAKIPVQVRGTERYFMQ